MICSSLCRVPFMAVLLSWVWENSHSRRSSFRGLGQNQTGIHFMFHQLVIKSLTLNVHFIVTISYPMSGLTGIALHPGKFPHPRPRRAIGGMEKGAESGIGCA